MKIIMFSLRSEKTLIVCIAIDRSITSGCAKAQETDWVAIGLDEKAESIVRALANEPTAEIAGPLDVSRPGATEQIFEIIGERRERLDTLIHSIAFASRADELGRSAVGLSRHGDNSIRADMCLDPRPR